MIVWLPVAALRLKSIMFSATLCILVAGAPAELPDTTNVYCPGLVVAAVATVTVTLTGVLAVGFTVADGANVHVTPVAGALHESDTVPANGPSALTCRLACELVPGGTLSVPGDAAPRTKSTTDKDMSDVFAAGAPAEFAATVSVYCPGGALLVVDTVTVTVTGLLDVGFTLADGAKLQVTPPAGALQLRSTAPLNDPIALTCTVNCEFVAGNMVSAAGEGVPNVKSTTFTVTGTWCVV